MSESEIKKCEEEIKRCEKEIKKCKLIEEESEIDSMSSLVNEYKNTEMSVEVIDHMGTDLNVVNAARVSFNKIHKELDGPDTKLINYLAKHNHWSPFSHTSIQLLIKVPIFVARQLGKHQVGLSWNEVSRRYVDVGIEFYSPTVWRKRSESAKQGSSKETMEFAIDDINKVCLRNYNNLLKKGVAPEMARMVLPQNMMTEFYWTGSLYAFARVCNLRLEEHSQWETKEIAKMISVECKKLFPISWEALVKE